jgi:hypothetical protein
MERGEVRMDRILAYAFESESKACEGDVALGHRIAPSAIGGDGSERDDR